MQIKNKDYMRSVLFQSVDEKYVAIRALQFIRQSVMQIKALWSDFINIINNGLPKVGH